MSAASTTIGFIGLGIMGAPMAGHLIRCGCRLFVHSRTRSKADALIATGATWCETPAEVGRRCAVLITIVPDTPDVERVLFGPGGAVETLPRGAIVVDMSTISPAATRQIGLRLAERDIALLDAPVTGGDSGARNATLTIMAGGPHEALERVLPLLSMMGKKIVHVGPNGSGQMMKACNQILCAVNMIALCEALTLAKQSGLDPAQMVDTLSTGAGGSWALANLGPKIVADDLKPAFMIKLIQKDLRIVQDEARRLALTLPGSTLAQRLFDNVAVRPGGGELGTQALIEAYDVPTAKQA